MTQCFVAALVAAVAGAIPTASARAVTGADAAIEVSFADSALVRLRGQQFVSRAGADVRALNAVVQRSSVGRIERVVATPEAEVDATRRRLIDAGRRGVPDLNRHYRIATAGAAARDDLLAALRRLDVVDVAIAAPRPAPPPVTPDFTSGQRYGGAAPAGIGAGAVAARPGGTGQEVKIVDIEYAWNQAHEDLAKAASALIPNGTPRDPFSSTHHGSAVVGVLVGTPNAFGVTGLAAGAALGLVNADTTEGHFPSSAVEVARQNLSPGDVILLEQQTRGVSGTGSQSDPYVPVEYIPSVYDAIRVATQSGIIVVEAAGNGGVNLDDAASYGSPFPDGRPDSGAIIVGAGSGDATCAAGSTPHARMPFSSYGARVDLQGWGQCVTTAGYGLLFDGGPNATYTGYFSGTSSAAAIVAAAAALFSSVFAAENGGRTPDPRYVRSRLVATGTAQGGTDHIGPLPNVAAAATGYDATPPTASLTTGPNGPTSDATPTFSFTASEPGATLECRVTGEPSFTPCTSPKTYATLTDGAKTFEVRAIDAAFNTGPAATRTFTVDTAGPAVAIEAGPSGPTNDPAPAFSFAASEPGATVECRLDGEPFAPCASPRSYAALTDGVRTFEVRATDALMNIGPVTTRAFTIDTVAPAVTIAAGPPDVGDDATPAFTFSSSEAGASFACRVGPASDSGAFAACASPYTSPALRPGPSVFAVRATDAAGNASALATWAFTIAEPTGGAGVVEQPPPLAAPLATPPVVATAPTIGPQTRIAARVRADRTVVLTRPQVTCPRTPPSCTVQVRARRLTAARTPIATQTIRFAAGTTARIRFRLSTHAYALLRRKRSLAATVTLTAVHGGATRARSLRVVFKR